MGYPWLGVMLVWLSVVAWQWSAQHWLHWSAQWQDEGLLQEQVLLSLRRGKVRSRHAVRGVFSVSLFISLHLCLSSYLCLSISMSVCLFISLSVCLSLYLSVSLLISVHLCLSSCLSPSLSLSLNWYQYFILCRRPMPAGLSPAGMNRPWRPRLTSHWSFLKIEWPSPTW